jgi:gas vesicle protein
MQKTNTKDMSTTKKVAIAAGVTGLLVAATLGTHFLFNTKKGKQSLKHIKSWAFKMKAEVLEKLERAKEVNEEVYKKIVDELAEKYKKVKGMTVEEVHEFAQELKSKWRSVHGEVKKTLNGGSNAKSKTKSKPKAAAKK